jgi:hypothetical protein
MRYDIENALAVVGLELKYTPGQLSKLYLDDLDHHGLFWWADRINEQNQKLKSK